MAFFDSWFCDHSFEVLRAVVGYRVYDDGTRLPMRTVVYLVCQKCGKDKEASFSTQFTPEQFRRLCEIKNWKNDKY